MSPNVMPEISARRAGPASGTSDIEQADSAKREIPDDGNIPRMHVAILIADGFADSGLSVALDVLRTANALARREQRPAPFRVSVVGPAKRVRAASGLTVGPTVSV